MEKKKAIKILTATAIATSAFAAAAPSQAASSLDKQISQAKSTIKKPYDTYANAKTLASVSTVSKAIAAAKKAESDAIKAINKAKLSASAKKTKIADLKKYEVYITRAQGYVNGYNAAAKASAALANQYAELEATVATKDVAKITAQYTALQNAIKAAKKQISAVYGSNTRTLLFNKFTKPTETKLAAGVEKALAEIKAEKEAKANADAYVALANGDLSTQAKVDAAQAAKAKIDLTKLNDTDKAAVTAADAKVAAAVEALKVPAVESVSAINGAQLVINFNKAVDEKTVIDTNSTTGVKTLKASVVGISKISGNGTVATLDTSSLASLSADGKTLTITATAGSFNNYKYVITVANTVTTVDGKAFPAYVSNVLETPDTVAPAVTSTQNVSSSKVRVTFSEPLSNVGSWSFKYADGTTTAPTVTVDSTNIAKGYVDLTVTSGIAGKAITATAIGVKDFASNLANPNPLTVTLTKGQLDGVAPTVSSVTSKGLNTFVVQFSEEVQGFDATDVTVTGATGVASVTQDATDKTKYTVTTTGITSAGLYTVSIGANTLTDLSGEANAAYSKVVNVTADSVAPTLVSSEIKKDASGYEYLYLTFDEAVSKGTLTALTATKYKDYVTTAGTIDLSDATAVDATNKQYKIKLGAAATKFTPTSGTAVALDANASYNVTLTGAFSDTSSNALGSKQITFIRGTDSLTVAQSVTSVAKVAGKPSTVKVTFAQPVDGASAINAANYNINGVVVDKAEIHAGEPNVVYLTLAAGSNTLTGERNVTINGVKTVDGVAQTTAYTGTVSLDENVAPTFTASLTDSKTITLKFSENASNVVESPTAAADFKVLVGGVDVTTFATPVTVTEGGTDGTATYTLTLSRDLTSAEYGNTITVVPTSAVDVTDSVGNVLNFTSVTVAK